MRLSKEEYRKAKDCLKRYSYNCVNILSTPNDIIGISGMNLDGMPHGKGGTNDIVANTVIKLEENKSYQRSIREYNIVRKALELVGEDTKYIFEHLYEKKNMGKWQIINNLNISEETYKRRYRELVYSVHEIMKGEE
jgi:hypothetical protein